MAKELRGVDLYLVGREAEVDVSHVHLSVGSARAENVIKDHSILPDKVVLELEPKMKRKHVILVVEEKPLADIYLPPDETVATYYSKGRARWDYIQG